MLYRVQAQVISTRSQDGQLATTSVGPPTFWVDALNAGEAVTKAHMVLLCDHRDSDARRVELTGSVIRHDDHEDYASFSYTSSGLVAR